MMRSQDDTCIVMKGGRKFRRLPMHVSMHIENESSGETCLRHRANTGDGSTLAKARPGNQPVTKEDLSTPTSQRLNSDDSGYLSPIINSDPDWYLRPRKLSTDTFPKKTYRSAKPSVLTQTRRLFLSDPRPNFVETRSSRKWFLNTEAILGGLICAILVASIGFTALISVRFFESKQANLNGKYKSMEFARQQRNLKETNVGADVGKVGKSRGRVSKEVPTAVTENPAHIPREPREDQLVNYEEPSMPKLETAELSMQVVQEELITSTPSGGIELLKSSKKRRSRNTNPLTKSNNKARMSAAKKPVVARMTEAPSTSLDYDTEPSTFRGRQELNDFDEDPSTFRGKQDPEEVEDTIENDYDNDPSTFRGKKKENEFNDYESDPSTFRGKQDSSDQPGAQKVVDIQA